MGANIDAGSAALNLLTGGIAGAVKRAGQPGGSGGTAGLLSLLTAGASEVGTGGGVYGDETLADTLFPKAINDMALTDRAEARKAADQKVADEKAAMDEQKPGPMDLTDESLAAARKSAKLKTLQGFGRASTFRTPATGGGTMPKLGMKKLYGL